MWVRDTSLQMSLSWQLEPGRNVDVEISWILIPSWSNRHDSRLQLTASKKLIISENKRDFLFKQTYDRIIFSPIIKLDSIYLLKKVIKKFRDWIWIRSSEYSFGEIGFIQNNKLMIYISSSDWWCPSHWECRKS